LPEGVVARLGSTRFRDLCDSICFSSDGKTLIGVAGGYQVYIWDTDSGKLLSTRRLGDRPYRTKWEIHTARSADGKTLLIAEGASLQMWDLPSGKRLDVRFPTGCKRLGPIGVSDDRRFLLLGDTVKEKFVETPLNGGSNGHLEIEQHLLLWDTTTGQQRRLAKDESMLIALSISPDGKRLASWSYGKGTSVYETETGKLLWRETKFRAETLKFTPDNRSLITASGGGQSALHIWDAATGRPSKAFPAPTLGSVWTFALSPDGSKLLAPTDTDYVLWDLQGGKVLHRWPGAKQSGKVAFAPDGRSVVTCDTILRRWDVASGESLYPDAAALGHTAPVRRLYFTPDGKRLASVGEDNAIRIWDVDAAKPIRTLGFNSSNRDRWDLSGDGDTGRYPDGWTLTPDGATLIGVDKLLTVHRWSLADGRTLPPYELRAAQQTDVRLGLRAMHVRVAPDGETLTMACRPRSPDYRYSRYSFSFWDAETGRLRRWGGDPGKEYRDKDAVLSPDGRFAVSDGQRIDTRTGERRRMQPTHDGAEAIGGVIVFSPDGRLLAALGKRGHLWEVVSGQPILDLPEIVTTSAPVQTAGRLGAFAPDGRRFALAAPRHLLVCDLQTGKILVKYPVPAYLPPDVNWARGGVAFAPDGRSIATACEDGNILLWDVPVLPRVERLTETETAALWQDLAQDAAKGYAAVWRLQEDAETAVPFLRKRLPPVPRPEVDWAKLIRQLDSDQFEQRENASRRLKTLGRAAEDVLRQAIKGNPTLEKKKRIEALLSALESSPRPPLTDWRAVRAVAVLEGINSPEARRVLAEWAKGLPGAALTNEAVQAMQ
jgi:WD40 repeat protein